MKEKLMAIKEAYENGIASHPHVTVFVLATISFFIGKWLG